MNNRSILLLCASLAFVIAISSWLYVKAPPATSMQIGEAGNTVLTVEDAQALATATEQGASSSRLQATDSLASTGDDEAEDETLATSGNSAQAAQNSDDFNKPSAEEPAQNADSSEEGGALVLSESVFAAIENVQQLQLDGQWEASLDVLNALYEDFDELNSFEQVTLLNFYTNTLLRFEMWPESIGAFSRMLTIPDLRPDIGARALMALGQLHAEVGQYAASISYLRSWQDVTVGMENMERSNARVNELLEQSRLGLQQANSEAQ